MAEIQCLQRYVPSIIVAFFFPCLDQSHRYDGRTLLFFDRRPPISAIIACTGLVNSCDFVICDNIDYIADSYSYKYTLVAFLLPNRTLRRSCYLFRKSRIAWRSKFARTTHAKIKTHLRITFVPDSFRSSIIVEIFFYLFFCFFFLTIKREALLQSLTTSLRLNLIFIYASIFILTNDKFSNLYTERGCIIGPIFTKTRVTI